MGSVGLIIGATIGQWINDSGVDPSKFTGLFCLRATDGRVLKPETSRRYSKVPKAMCLSLYLVLSPHTARILPLERGHGIRGARYSSGAY